jgi:CpeS-like protein
MVPLAFSLALPLRGGGVRAPCAAAPSPRTARAAAPRPRACADPAVEAGSVPRADDAIYDGAPWMSPEFLPAPEGRFESAGVEVVDAMEFFRLREGRWASWRVTHHLAFRRSESGESVIEMRCLEKDDEQIVKLMDDNGIPREAAVGGCYVTWKATMAWDQEGENHEGSTVFALVPDRDDQRRGRIVRDRGYAEIVPIAGTYRLDAEDALCLDTPYDGGAVEERFMFDGPNKLHRVSTVRRFGGLSNATFATETRLASANGSPVEAALPAEAELTDDEVQSILNGDLFMFSTGATGDEPDGVGAEAPAQRQGSFLGAASAKRMSDAAAAARAAGSGRPSPGSAFGTGFSAPVRPPGGGAESAAEKKAGIDLSKVPPSMRADFEKSLGLGGDGEA